MTLVALTVYRKKKLFDSQGVNVAASEAWTVDDSQIAEAIPSVCKTDAGTHGLVNSKVIVNSEQPNNPYILFCSETTAAIAALS